MQKRLISFDWAIKKILRNKANFEILEGFLSELIAPNKNLKIVKLLDSESNKESKEDKSNRVDILVEIEPDEIVLIEVQVNRQLDFLHRMLFGTSKVITEYISSGQKYEKIRKVYSVNILYFDIGQGEDYLYTGTTEFIGVHKHDQLQLSQAQQEQYNKKLVSEIYPEYFIIKINNFDDLAKDSLDEWIYFLKNEEIKPEFQAKGLLKAKAELDVLKLSDADRQTYQYYQDDLHYQASMVETNYADGEFKGRKEGRIEGATEREQQIVLNMLNNDFALATIATVTGLSPEKIKAIAEQNKL